MFALGTQVALSLSFVVVLAVSILLGRRQGRGGMGGRISRPKQIWLGYAVYTWFFVCPSLAIFEPSMARAPRLALALFGGFMWIRGVLELVMLYGTKNWRPPFGVAHDLASIALILATLGLMDVTITSSLDRWTLAFIGNVVLSLCFETYYALAFHGAVRGKTTGEDGIWFADEDDPKFRTINRVTTIGNVLLAGFLALFLLAGFWSG